MTRVDLHGLAHQNEKPNPKDISDAQYMQMISTSQMKQWIYTYNDIRTVSDNLNFILYADDTTLSCPMCSFTRECNGDIELVSILINSELDKIADWLAVNKLSLNVQKN